jgi:hypothetical protein
LSWPGLSLINKILIMQKLSMRKYSVLGLVLLAASAVTAAVIPSKSNKGKSDKKDVKFAGFSLTRVSASPDGSAPLSSVTCEPDTNVPAHITDAACGWTDTGAGSQTTVSPNGSSDPLNQQESSVHNGPDNDADPGQSNTSDAS